MRHVPARATGHEVPAQAASRWRALSDVSRLSETNARNHVWALPSPDSCTGPQRKVLSLVLAPPGARSSPAHTDVQGLPNEVHAATSTGSSLQQMLEAKPLDGARSVC